LDIIGEGVIFVANSAFDVGSEAVEGTSVMEIIKDTIQKILIYKIY